MAMLKTSVEHCMLIAREVVGAATALRWGRRGAGINTEGFLQEEGIGSGP